MPMLATEINMNLTSETLNYILGVVALFTTAFGIWGAIKKPQEVMKQAQAEETQRALLLAQQFQQEKEANVAKFLDINTRLEVAAAMTTKDMHALDLKLETFVSAQQLRNEENSNNFVKLFVLLDERLPGLKNRL